MASLQYFQKLGWHISPEGYNLITKKDSLKDIKEITKIACDTDLKEIGSPVLSKELEGNVLTGPIVLQIQKIRNISAPKSNESSGAAPRLIKLILSDGHTTCQAIEFGQISNINLTKTPPGTKLLIKNAQVLGSYVLLADKNVNILGGNVQALVERWQLSKSITKHVREGFDGPPPWVPFGQKVQQSIITDRNFKSLDTGKPKEQSKDEFDAQREEAIAEAAQGAVRKVFGGGAAKSLPNKDNQRYPNNRRQSNKPQTEERKNSGGKIEKKKGRDKETTEVLKPTGKISLFAFLEDKLPTTTTELEKIEETTENNHQSKYSKATYADKYDASLRHRGNENPNKSSQQKGNKGREKQNYDSEKNNPKDTKNLAYDHRNPQRVQNEKAPRFQRQQNPQSNNQTYPNSINNLIKKTNDMSLQSTNTDNKPQQFNRPNRNQSNTASGGGPMNVNKFNTVPNRPHSSYNPRSNNNQNFGNNYYNDNNSRPPYFKQNEYEQFYQNNQQQSRPRNTQYPVNPHNSGFVNRDSNTMPFEKQKNPEINTNINNTQSNNALWKWKVGDQCMAKYWEDNQFYNASITGVTPRTCMVRFNEYGNFEEVLKADCVPLVNNSNNTSSNMNINRQYTGSLVFRRGGHGSQPINRDYD
ncbi:tudor domain-containing protein 3-like [Chrysoperla carnea]|uniref:tudor domain-containing protein 3-like n=1 Tax=Chrysoperla carnea TaxID=189513 RepID=UPI001D090B95|nr:tudor domain-containing protein 3-like [Chrysoperla carnea]